ncbi:MAG: hypothetical protein HY320_11480 [Armatimonadetes bacterium]|nr:hypothetical protein [Armatimonadota bacterium]
MREASCIREEVVYRLARHATALRIEEEAPPQRRQQRSPAMAAELTNHIGAICELRTIRPVPVAHNS